MKTIKLPAEDSIDKFLVNIKESFVINYENNSAIVKFNFWLRTVTFNVEFDNIVEKYEHDILIYAQFMPKQSLHKDYILEFAIINMIIDDLNELLTTYRFNVLDYASHIREITAGNLKQVIRVKTCHCIVHSCIGKSDPIVLITEHYFKPP